VILFRQQQDLRALTRDGFRTGADELAGSPREPAGEPV